MITILTITGSDSTGLSGAQADIRTIAALGCHAASAVTTITVQSTIGIQRFYDVPAHIISGQVEVVMNDLQPQVIKVGMLRNAAAVEAVVAALVKYKPRWVVYDPMVYARNGQRLMSPEVVDLIIHRLLPLCQLVIVRRRESLIIGSALSTGRLVSCDETLLHGQTNSFSSAVAAFLAMGRTLDEALNEAESYLHNLVARADRPTSRGDELYNTFIRTVQKHHRTNSDVAFYADSLNVSSRYLAQVCHQAVGRSPKSIIDTVLMESIRKQLTTTNRTLQETAFDFGFSSPAHFTKFVKKQSGYTPTALRQILPSETNYNKK